MDQLKYEVLAEIQGRLEADVIESYLEAHGIDVELIQASIDRSSYVTMLGRVQVFVPKDKIREARELFKVYQEGIEKE